MWVWLLLVLALLAGVLYTRDLWRKIAALVTYVLCLLVSDEFRDREKSRLDHWVQTADSRGDKPLMMLTSAFVLQAAQALAKRGPVEMTMTPAPRSAKKAA